MVEGSRGEIEGLTNFDPIGTGGFSTVYRAWDLIFERSVAVKVLHRLDPDGQRRFDRELRIMGQLSSHTNVITPFRAGYTTVGIPYLVMEYVDGGSLADLIESEGSIPWPRAVDYILAVTEALAHAHGQGVLHRDVKPENILLGPGGPKLTDFGIAAIRESTTSQVAYTLAHCPPETFNDGRDARDERSDIYSTASTLYSLLAGRAPYDVTGPDSPLAYMYRILDQEPAPLPTGAAPPELEAALVTSLTKDPDERPQSAEALAALLRDVRKKADQLHGDDPVAASGGWSPSEVPPLLDRLVNERMSEPTVVDDVPEPGGIPTTALPPALSPDPSMWAPPSTGPAHPEVPLSSLPPPSVPPSESSNQQPPVDPAESREAAISSGSMSPSVEPSAAPVPAPASAPSMSVSAESTAAPLPANPVWQLDADPDAPPKWRRRLLAGVTAGVVAVAVLGVALLAIVDDGASGSDDQAQSDSDDDAVAASDDDGADDADDEGVEPGEDTAGDANGLPAIGELTGTSVRIIGAESNDGEVDAIQAALDLFAEEHGMTIVYEGSDDLVDDLGDGPAGAGESDVADIVIAAQPAVIRTLAEAGRVVELDPAVADAIDHWRDDLRVSGRIDGVDYGVPTRSEIKSLVWYQPARFDELGYDVPATWDELEALTVEAAADGNTPWCVGIASGRDNGWPFTDWVEDLVLRTDGPAVYDAWAAGRVPFTDPRIVGAFETIDELWSIPGAVHTTDDEPIGTTPFWVGAPSLVSGDCLMVRHGSLFSSFFDSGTSFGGPDDDAVDVFLLPPTADGESSALVSTVTAAATDDRPEVWAVMAYLGSAAYADERQRVQSGRNDGDEARPSGFLSEVGVDPELLSPIEQKMLRLLTGAEVRRLDASDSMPAAVGIEAFWTEGIRFTDGRATVEEATAAIEAAWP